MDIKLKSLNEKAMLVKLTTRRANLSKRDEHAEAVIQQQMDDASLVVVSKLFRDKANPVNKVLSTLSEVYTYHKKHTLPYMDKGPRILPNGLYMDYTTEIHALIGNMDTQLQAVVPNYDLYVDQDILFRNGGKAVGRASRDDYPQAHEFESRVGIDLRFMPLPDKKHFLFDLSDDDVQNFSQAMHEVEVAANNDAVNRMLEPLKHLVDKLSKPIGTEGAIFRDSAIENVVENAELAKKLLLDPEPGVLRAVDDLINTVSQYHSAWLRESPVVREQAAKKLDDIAKQMGTFMGA